MPGGRWSRESKLIGKSNWYIRVKSTGEERGPYFTKAQAKDEAFDLPSRSYEIYKKESNPHIGELIPCHAIRMRKDGGIDVIGAHTNPRRRRRARR